MSSNKSTKKKYADYIKSSGDPVLDNVVNSAKGTDSRIDLKNRKKVSSSKLKEKGWNVDSRDSYATVYSSGYSNKDGTKTVTVTPISQDGKTVLSPSQLRKEATDALDGKKTKHAVVMATHTGKDSIAQSNKFAQDIHYGHSRQNSSKKTISNGSKKKSGLPYKNSK